MSRGISDVGRLLEPFLTSWNRWLDFVHALFPLQQFRPKSFDPRMHYLHYGAQGLR